MVTLTGPGGVGKTSVALRVATDLAPTQRDGAWWCELAAITSDDAVPDVIMTALGLQPRHGMTATERITEYLCDASTLLVLDNDEHLIVAVARLVTAIVRGCGAVTVLVTSRERLAVDGERVLVVPPLAVPEADAPAAGHAAVELFARRAAEVSEDSPRPPTTRTRSPRSAGASTVCRWRWNWRRPACAR